MARLRDSGALVYAGIEDVVSEMKSMRFRDALNRITKRQMLTVDRFDSGEDQLASAKAFADRRDPVFIGTEGVL